MVTPQDPAQQPRKPRPRSRQPLLHDRYELLDVRDVNLSVGVEAGSANNPAGLLGGAGSAELTSLNGLGLEPGRQRLIGQVHVFDQPDIPQCMQVVPAHERLKLILVWSV